MSSPTKCHFAIFFESPPPRLRPRPPGFLLAHPPPLSPSTSLLPAGLNFSLFSPRELCKLHCFPAASCPACPPSARSSVPPATAPPSRAAAASIWNFKWRERRRGGEGAFLSWHSHGERGRKETWRIFRDLCQSDVPLLSKRKKKVSPTFSSEGCHGDCSYLGNHLFSQNWLFTLHA